MIDRITYVCQHRDVTEQYCNRDSRTCDRSREGICRYSRISQLTDEQARELADTLDVTLSETNRI